MDCCLYLTLSMGISPFFSKKTTLSFSIFSSDHFNCERPYYCISNTTKHLYRKTETEKERRLILFILSIIPFCLLLFAFSHPDFTVGFGFSPNPPFYKFKSYKTGHGLRVLHPLITAGWEFHPTPKAITHSV